MKPDLIYHLRELRPTLDVHGQWLLIGNAKTAQKSIALGALKEKWIFHRRGYHNWKVVWDELFVPRMDEVFMFTFVRNPWDRILSAFFFLQKRHVIAEDIEFRDYIKNVFAMAGPSVNMHFREQAPSFLFNGKPFNIFIGRFEKLEEDWEYIASRIKAERFLPHINATEHTHYTDYYDDKCVEIVRDLYREEIDALGYEFGSN